jgi:predicted double-glycine peptidase
MRWQSGLSIAFFFALLLVLSVDARAGEVVVDADSGFVAKVASFKELRMSRVVKQNYDFSCGSAAVATLLTYSYDMPTTEQQAFEKMYAVGDQTHIRKVGFSLLDMKKYLANRGIQADGYKVSMDQLHDLRMPLITLISPGGYNHFVVLRGWSRDSILIADPALGLRRMSASGLEQIWNGVVFVLRDNVSIARNHYNDPGDLKILPLSYNDDAMIFAREGLTNFFLNQRGINEF